MLRRSLRAARQQRGLLPETLTQTNALTVTLASSDTTEATATGTVTIPAGQFNSAPFNINSIDDSIVDGTQTVTFTASAAGHAAGTDMVDVTDDDTAALAIAIVATSIDENGGSTTATISRNTDIANSLVVTLTSSDISEAVVPTTITIPAGQSVSAPFNISAIDDAVVDGVQIVTITSSASGHIDAADTLDVQDDESPLLSLVIAHSSVSENAGPAATVGTVSRNTDTTNGLVVTLTSSDTSEATVPATVTIPAGQTTSPPFNIAAVDDQIVDGSQTVGITAAASGHSDGVATLDVADDETIALSASLSVTSITEAAGTTTLTATLESASTADLSFTLNFSGTAERGADFLADTELTIPAGQLSAQTVLTAIDNESYQADKAIEFSINPGPGLNGEVFSVVITEDDKGSFSASGNSSPLQIAEDGSTAEVSVVLDVAPLTGVSVLASVDDATEASLSTSVLSFDPENWNVPQTITVTGVGDLAEDGDQAFTVSLQVDEANSESGFAGLAPITIDGVNANVSVTNIKVDRVGDEIVVTNGDTGQQIMVESDLNQPIIIDLSESAATLTLGQLGDFGSVVEIIHQNDDTIEYGDGWVVESPIFSDGEFAHVLTRDATTVRVINERPHQNPYQIHDVNRDGRVSALDALLGINQLIRQAGNSNVLPAPTTEAVNAGFFYYDVTADGRATALDALRVINRMIQIESCRDQNWLSGEFWQHDAVFNSKSISKIDDNANDAVLEDEANLFDKRNTCSQGWHRSTWLPN